MISTKNISCWQMRILFSIIKLECWQREKTFADVSLYLLKYFFRKKNGVRIVQLNEMENIAFV